MLRFLNLDLFHLNQCITYSDWIDTSSDVADYVDDSAYTQIHKVIMSELIASIEEHLDAGKPLLITDLYEVFNEMIFKQSEEQDIYVPEQSIRSFKRDIDEWLNSERSKELGYEKRVDNSGYIQLGTLLYKRSWDMLQIVHELTGLVNSPTEEGNPNHDQFTLFNRQADGITPSEMLHSIKELRERLKRQKLICQLYGRYILHAFFVSPS